MVISLLSGFSPGLLTTYQVPCPFKYGSKFGVFRVLSCVASFLFQPANKYTCSNHHSKHAGHQFLQIYLISGIAFWKPHRLPGDHAFLANLKTPLIFISQLAEQETKTRSRGFQRKMQGPRSIAGQKRGPSPKKLDMAGISGLAHLDF